MAGKISFIKSAVLPKDYPIHRKLEVAFMGRSNAGKSSLINNLSKTKIAKVSQTPGKTRLLNFFDFDKYVLVDMPGYGYASRSGSEIAEWQPMIEEYLSERDSLVGLVLVMDIRRKWTKDELILSQFVQSHGRPVAIALTKADKITKTEAQKFLAKHKKDSKINAVFVISNTKQSGYEELEDYIYRSWVKDVAIEDVFDGDNEDEESRS
jgi:GTP-binding protein